MPDFDAFATGVYPVEPLPYIIWYDELYTPQRDSIFAAMMECVARTRQPDIRDRARARLPWDTIAPAEADDAPV